MLLHWHLYSDDMREQFQGIQYGTKLNGYHGNRRKVKGAIPCTHLGGVHKHVRNATSYNSNSGEGEHSGFVPEEGHRGRNVIRTLRLLHLSCYVNAHHSLLLI